jgi:hypothetical protein
MNRSRRHFPGRTAAAVIVAGAKPYLTREYRKGCGIPRRAGGPAPVRS